MKILFVDDEKNVLQGLKRSLRSMRRQWDMEFVESGTAALQAMKAADPPFEIVVSDMRMPGMDGSEVLHHIRQKYPHVLRIALSGGTDDTITYRTTHVAHQFLSKPCSSEVLKSVLQGGGAILQLMNKTPLRNILTNLSTIPSMPGVLVELQQELNREEPSMKRVGTIIASDIGMTAKILQLVNSAFFGVSHQVNSAEQAVTMLGLETVKALVLTVGIFTSFDHDLFPEFDMHNEWRHGRIVGKAARAICAAEKVSETAAENALLAGTLHDVGKVLLASYAPVHYREVLARVDAGSSLLDAEMEVLGATHAEAGAYVLGTWGLQTDVVYSIGLHHQPRKIEQGNDMMIAAVHVANAAWHEHTQGNGSAVDKYNQEFIDATLPPDRISVWQKLCHETFEQETESNG